MIDATHLQMHRTAFSLRLKKWGDRPLRIFLTVGQRSDYIGARALLDGFPPAANMLADRRYDEDWYREAPEDKGITPCIPSRKNRKVPIPYDEA